MTKQPKVSVVTISYNQEHYIGEALESIVSQEADFSFEVIVADDGSKDGTQRIIKEYAKKYPEIIKPILRSTNIGAYQNFRDALQHVCGKYLAMCEGDDFWTDNSKLQKQVDFLEANSRYALCFHPVRVFFDTGNKREYVFPDKDKQSKFTLTNLLHDNFIQTNSVMYKARDYSKLPEHVMPADWYMHIYHARYGQIGYIDKVMAAYRKHESGLWWNSQKGEDQFWIKIGMDHLLLHEEIVKLFNGDEAKQKIIRKSASRAIEAFLKVAIKQKDISYLIEAVGKFPDMAVTQMLAEAKRFRDLQKVLEATYAHVSNLEAIVAAREAELESIKQSRTWKAYTQLRKARH